MTKTELKEAIEAIGEYDPIMGDYIKEAIRNPECFKDEIKEGWLFIDYFESHENSQTEYSNAYKIAEHLELFELTAKMEAIENQETEDFFEDERMKKDYLN